MQLTLKKKKSKSDWVKVSDTQALKVDYPTLEQAQLLEDILLDEDINDKKRMLKYQRYFLKFSIKDWKGLVDKCELIDNELELSLWQSLTLSFTQTTALFDLVNKELEWTEFDKKK